MEVASELLSFRKALLEGTITMVIEAIVDDDLVNMHLYQPSFQGCIVVVVTVVPIVPTAPDAKSKLAKRLKSCPPRIYAKSFVPLRKNTDNVLVVADVKKLRCIFLAPEAPLPVKINAPAEAKMENSSMLQY